MTKPKRKIDFTPRRHKWERLFSHKSLRLPRRMDGLYRRYPKEWEAIIKGKKKVIAERKARKVLPHQVKKRREGSFVVNGVNSNETIRNLKTINGIKIEELEKEMQGRTADWRYLGEKEKLLDIMATDNEFVLSQRLTHQQLAKPLFQIVNEALKLDSRYYTIRMSVNGQNLEIKCGGFPMLEYSPFQDGAIHGYHFKVTNLSNGKELRFSAIHPYLMSQYGFYEGKKVEYRIEPKEIIEFFGLKAKNT
ncbi:hypothetical protein KKG83_01125 [Candidatus Micrarchaeota archaeon]|nr:hypothetical protein [Candidatus Micrarchaeota archaeon]